MKSQDFEAYEAPESLGWRDAGQCTLGGSHDSAPRSDQTSEVIAPHTIKAVAEVALPQAVAPRGVRAKGIKVPARWRRPVIARMEGNGFAHFDDARREAVVGDSVCRELIANDGTRTYAVKSTEEFVAQRAFQAGFRFPRGAFSPHLSSEALMLAGPGRRQHGFNIEALSLVYGFREKPVLLVLGFPEPSPGNANRVDPFSGTFLGSTGKYIKCDLNDPDYRPWVIPSQFVAGYYDQTTEKFVHNPSYWGVELNGLSDHPSATSLEIDTLK